MAHALNFPSGGYIVALQYFCNIIFAFLQHVPSTLRLNGTPLIKKRDVTDVGPQLTSFDTNKVRSFDRSCVARAADLNWIVGPRYSSDRYILGCSTYLEKYENQQKKPWNYLEKQWKSTKTTKLPYITMKTNQKPMKLPCKNHENQTKTMKNHETTLINHKNQSSPWKPWNRIEKPNKLTQNRENHETMNLPWKPMRTNQNHETTFKKPPAVAPRSLMRQNCHTWVPTRSLRGQKCHTWGFLQGPF